MKSSQKKKSPPKKASYRAAPSEVPLVSIPFRLPQSTADALNEFSRKEGISRNAVLNIATSRILKEGI